MIITDISVIDLRFPTSRELDGSDAMNADPDYSAAYIILHTDTELEGHGLTFTLGRGNELCVAAVESLKPLVIGRTLDGITNDMAGFWRDLVGDSQMRWVGPEKGVTHMAMGGVINAVWDLWARKANKPLWRLLADLSPEQLVACIDFRHITDALHPDEALDMLKSMTDGRDARTDKMLADGYPAYTTSAGWLGYPDDKMRRLCQDAMDQGLTHLKIKVGRSLDDDIRRAALMREVMGDDLFLMMDANQVWDVDQAIANMHALSEYKPWWIEEPTSPDDILGHKKIRDAISPIGVATGEQCHNRIMFKQFLQAEAIDFCQIDSCRVGGVNEVLAIMLMANKFNVPVCPHAGGVGLCEYVQHLSLFDYIGISGSTKNRVIEYVDHLHEHFLDPVVIRDGHYIPPQKPGYSIEVKADTLKEYAYPHGSVWQGTM